MKWNLYPSIVQGFAEDTFLLFQKSSSAVKQISLIALGMPVGNIAAMKAAPVGLLADGTTVKVSGYYSPGDGGGGNFVWNSASTATPNLGTVFQANVGGVGRFIRTIVNGEINARGFGAVGDGVTNDYNSLQAAFNFIAGTTYSLVIPNGDFATETGLILINTGYNVIRGSGATVIRYTGNNASTKILTMDDCYMVEVRNLRILASTPAAVGVWFKNGTGVTYVSTRCKLIDLEIDGITDNIGTCVRIGGTGSIDGNNDFHLIQNSILTNFSAEGISLEHSQVYNIQLRGTMILGNGAGVHLINASKGPGGFGGSFSWIGGGGGGVTGAAIFLGVPTNGPTLVQDVNFESTDRLLESAFGASGFIYNVAFKDCRWAADALNADGKMIKWNYAGTVMIDGGNYGDGSAAPRALTIEYAANYPTYSSLILVGALFHSTATTGATLATSLPALMIKCNNYNQTTDTFGSYASEYYPDGFPYLSNQRLFTGSLAGLQKVRAENLSVTGEVAIELATPNVAGAHTFQLRQFGNQVWLYDATAAAPILKVLLDTSKAVVLANGAWLLDGTGAPENVVLAPVGSMYLNRSGGAGTTLYIKEGGGSGDTGWQAK